MHILASLPSQPIAQGSSTTLLSTTGLGRGSPAMGPGRRGTKQASLLWSMALGSIGSAVLFPGSRARAQQLWCTGLVPPRHVGSSWVRGRTGVPCKADLNHWTTREAHPLCFNYYGLIVILLSGKTSASPMFFFIYVFPIDRTFSWFKHTKI